ARVVGGPARRQAPARSGARRVARARDPHPRVRPRPAGGRTTDAPPRGRSGAGMLPRAIAAAEQLGWPVALKLDAPGLAHKSDIGAVELKVAGPTQLAASLRRVLAAGREHEPDGVLIQPM